MVIVPWYVVASANLVSVVTEFYVCCSLENYEQFPTIVSSVINMVKPLSCVNRNLICSELRGMPRAWSQIRSMQEGETSFQERRSLLLLWENWPFT